MVYVLAEKSEVVLVMGFARRDDSALPNDKDKRCDTEVRVEGDYIQENRDKCNMMGDSSEENTRSERRLS